MLRLCAFLSSLSLVQMKEYMGEKVHESLLEENKNRFVIFPIKHNKVGKKCDMRSSLLHLAAMSFVSCDIQCSGVLVVTMFGDMLRGMLSTPEEPCSATRRRQSPECHVNKNRCGCLSKART